MTRFTDSPFERMMTQKPRGGGHPRRAPTLPKDPPSYGSNQAGQTSVGLCHREMLHYLKEMKEPK